MNSATRNFAEFKIETQDGLPRILARTMEKQDMSLRSSSLLRLALIFNLAFSALCASALLLVGPMIAQTLGGFPNWIMTGLGVGLVCFVALIALALARLRIGLALIISVLDLLWVAGTLPLLAVPSLLTGLGAGIVLAVGTVVGLAGVMQLRGIHAMLCVDGGLANTFRHCVVMKSKMEPDELWAVVRKLGSISLYSEAVKSSRLENSGEPEHGIVRVCTNNNDQSWSEEVITIDDESHSLLLRFCSEADDFPFPFAEMSGGWTVKPTPEGGSLVEIWWQVRPRQRYFGWLVLALATIPLDRDIRRTIAAMEVGGTAQARTASALPSFAYC